MPELFPMLAGLLAGAVLSGVAPRIRVWLGAGLAVVLGFCATVLSGEFRIGWEYLLVDIPLVAVSAVGGFVLVRWLRGRDLERGASHG
jgi:FtsH-binding integral membrane protein